jgi:hypothetical protein
MAAPCSSSEDSRVEPAGVSKYMSSAVNQSVVPGPQLYGETSRVPFTDHSHVVRFYPPGILLSPHDSTACILNNLPHPSRLHTCRRPVQISTLVPQSMPSMSNLTSNGHEIVRIRIPTLLFMGQSRNTFLMQRRLLHQMTRSPLVYLSCIGMLQQPLSSVRTTLCSYPIRPPGVDQRHPPTTTFALRTVHPWVRSIIPAISQHLGENNTCTFQLDVS